MPQGGTAEGLKWMLFEDFFPSCFSNSHGKFPKADEASQSILVIQMNILSTSRFSFYPISLLATTAKAT